jgi:hypothetical protein
MPQLLLPGILKCICAKECDCENPPPDDWDGKSGVWYISNECPIHNWNPYPNRECPIHGKMNLFEFTTRNDGGEK